MKSIPYFDAHCDTISCCAGDGRALRENAGHLDLARLNGFERAAQCFAMFHDLADAPADSMFAEAKRQQAAEIQAANAAGKVAAVLSCEGSELLNCDPDNLDWAHAVGVKIINLTWNHSNFLCGSNVGEAERGLNDYGRAVVRAMENVVLVGMPGCSKKTLAQKVGKALGRHNVSSDVFVQDIAGMTYRRFSSE